MNWCELGLVWAHMIEIVLSGVVAYLLGCISPAFIITHITHGIDIRDTGDRTASVRDVFHTAGLWAATASALFDLAKGVAAMLVARALIGIPVDFVFVPALAVILGHIFPFYLGFRGGRGTTTALGLYSYYCLKALCAEAFSLSSLVSILMVALIAFSVTRKAELAGCISFLFLAGLTVYEMGSDAIGILCLTLSAFMFATTLRDAIACNLFTIEREVEIKLWRLIARPFALLFIPIDIWLGRRLLLLIIGSLALVFIATDIFRFATKLSLPMFFKKGEGRRFSSMTGFLVSNFIAFLAFPETIPYLALTFVTIGDLFSKFFGLKFGRTVVFRGKTLEGTLGFLLGSYMAAYLLATLAPVGIVFIIVGSLVASAVELFSVDVDDNFTVSIISGAFLTALRFFTRL